MGNIAQKFIPHIFHFFFLLNILHQLIIGALQFRNCLLQTLGHNIEIIPERSDLILSTSGVPCVKIQL